MLVALSGPVRRGYFHREAVGWNAASGTFATWGECRSLTAYRRKAKVPNTNCRLPVAGTKSPRVHRRVAPLSLPKIPSGWIRVVRQNHRILESDVYDPARACSGREAVAAADARALLEVDGFGEVVRGEGLASDLSGG